MNSKGQLFRNALDKETPLQIVGTVNAYSAMQATRHGFQALYLSGAGVANVSYGLPDLGMTQLDNVLTDLQRITDCTDLPVLVDADTGWGNALNIARTVKRLEKNQAAGCHIEDQVLAKRCGHRPNKSIISQSEMIDRIKAAVDAKLDPNFVIMARTDALAVEGLEAAIERAAACVEAGADMIFAEAMMSLDQYQQFCQALSVPILANITEFGKTPLLTPEALKQVGIAMILYPLSAFRAMAKAADLVYATIRQQGTVKNILQTMQTREELYEVLNYHQFETFIDQFNDEDKEERI